VDLKPAYFINRELSWLEFNQRVLDEALDATNPLLERIKFFAITSSNLDEFFEVRVAGLKQQMESDVEERSLDGLTATETFHAIGKRVRLMVVQQYRAWRADLVPALAQHGTIFATIGKLRASDLTWLDHYYRAHVRPVLTPLLIDLAHPFPLLLNKSLNLIVQLEITKDGSPQSRLAIVQVPRVLPPLIRLPRSGAQNRFLMLGDLIGHFLGGLFSGTTILGHWEFRVTRNSELYIDEEESANLLKAVENELQKRRRGDAVRLEIERGCPKELQHQLLQSQNLTEADLYVINGPLSPGRLMMIYEGDHSPELRDPPFVAPLPPAWREAPDIFAVIRKNDILLHHPYDNFDAVAEFLERAATDPQVLAIKQTLYRTGGDPRVIGALMKAVNQGKQVTAVVELKARFDEANNIEWARRLEEAGVQVVYGLVGYKIHGKICLVVRREQHGLRRYVHLSTGNYNPITARLYTDLGLLTCHPDFGEDATNVFNLLTGVCQFQRLRQLMMAPFDLHERMLALIEREIRHAQRGLPARIIAKMNSLGGREIVEALYRASQAGVQIDLIVRGICCLRPGLKGLSENIKVRSIVDRFLEHSRIFYFENACQPEVFIGSADCMPRNFFTRIELVFPINNGVLRERIQSEILQITLKDNVKSRLMRAHGAYDRNLPQPGETPARSQVEFMRLAKERSGLTTHAPEGKGKYPQVKVAPLTQLCH
jgi:polyphosphate kinase